MNFIKKCPVFFLLAVSGLVFTLVGAIGRLSIYKDYEFDIVKRPFLALVMEGASKRTMPWGIAENMGMGEDEFPGSLLALFHKNSVGQGNGHMDGEDALETFAGEDVVAGMEESSAVSDIGMDGTDVGKGGMADGEMDDGGAGSWGFAEGEGRPESEGSLKGEGSPEGEGSLEGGGRSKSEGRFENGRISESGIGSESERSLESGGHPESEGNLESGEAFEEPRSYDFQTVTEDYFNDAAFIGDSRTVGLFEYGGIEERADFYAKISLTIYNVFTELLAREEGTGEKITVEEAFSQKQYGKVYLMLGINELGTGTTATFMEEYREVVGRIRELQPDAVIFVEGIMKVTGSKNAEDPIFNNRNIEEKNAAIAQLADNQNIFYIDVNEAVCDGEGNLNEEYTIDEVHLKAKYYEIWKQFLLEHGIER